jgi:hypothetical protein
MKRVNKALMCLFLCLVLTRTYAGTNHEIGALFECLSACPQPNEKIKMLEEIKKLSQAKTDEEQKEGYEKVQQAIDNAATKPKASTKMEWIKSNSIPFLVGSMCALAIVGILQ